jgi:hypothetical protein
MDSMEKCILKFVIDAKKNCGQLVLANNGGIAALSL